jgi:hypothetical protein|eukprot:COSAG01_NODE_737_length_13945_cov_10.858082_13_plen_99_part_00
MLAQDANIVKRAYTDKTGGEMLQLCLSSGVGVCVLENFIHSGCTVGSLARVTSASESRRTSVVAVPGAAPPWLPTAGGTLRSCHAQQPTARVYTLRVN